MAPAKKNQLSTENALASVQVYMQQQYRPYSVSDILLNMHNVLTKPKLITILDTLVADQQLVCKTIGKASYYVYKKQECVLDNTSKTETSECLNQQIKDLKQEICHLKLKLQEIVTTPTNEELDNLIEVYTKKIENLSLELEKCRHNTSVTGAQNELKKYVVQLTKARKERIIMFNNLVSTVKEVTGQTNILDVCGIDEEEMKKFT
ncbi:hypothetical protein MG7_03834 [Candida albicans P34048]|nr:hypothetical protein MG7_03834 [Candida albicans P34048]